MKRALFILAAGIALMSCNPKTEQAEKPAVTATSSNGPGNSIFTRNVDSFFIDFQTGSTKINNWRTFISQHAQHMAPFASSSAFVIPASTIKYLVDSNHEEYVVFYIALNSTSDTLSLVYQGGKEQIEKNGDTVIAFAPAKIDTNLNTNAIYTLDNTWPCPVCPVNGLMATKGTYTVPYHHIVPRK